MASPHTDLPTDPVTSPDPTLPSTPDPSTTASIPTLPESTAGLTSDPVISITGLTMATTPIGTPTLSSSSLPAASSPAVTTVILPTSSTISSVAPPPTSSRSTSSIPSSPPPPPPTSSSTSIPPPPPPTSTFVPPPPPPPTSTFVPPPPPTSTFSPPPPPPPTSIPDPFSFPPTLTTFSSTFFLTTTDAFGSTTTSAPATFTSYFVTTESNGGATTITQLGINPTLSPDNRPSSSTSFFRKTGAVAGVFALVGLAAAAILLWVIFAVRRRRWRQQLEYDTATGSALTAAGFHRSPLDDEDEVLPGNGSSFSSPAMEMTNRSSSGLGITPPMAARTSGNFVTSAYEDPGDPTFNPYADIFLPSAARQGYVPARTASPPPAVARGHSRQDSNGSVVEPRLVSHTASNSAGSTEPLLNARERRLSNSPPPYYTAIAPPQPPPRNPMRLVDRLSLDSPVLAGENPSATSVYSSNSVGDERLDPGLRQRLGTGDAKNPPRQELRDEEDYSRPVLAVRNPPDTSGGSGRV